MTGEEMERLMAFILEKQAQINATMARRDRRLNRPASKIDPSYDRCMALLATSKHARKMRQMDEQFNALLKIVERHIGEGRNGKA
ncbi:MAG TPA: hypothetical protein VGP08_00905 [Pyrinomonadaceae bacterium]|jgi:hypothetical protein|nr:hypothetical protein [Pyrinomonadaceae bacterium]